MIVWSDKTYIRQLMIMITIWTSAPLDGWWYETYWQWLFRRRTRETSPRDPRHTPETFTMTLKASLDSIQWTLFRTFAGIFCSYSQKFNLIYREPHSSRKSNSTVLLQANLQITFISSEVCTYGKILNTRQTQFLLLPSEELKMGDLIRLLVLLNWPPENHMKITWKPHENHLKTTWKPP